jgi:hypothetical protein
LHVAVQNSPATPPAQVARDVRLLALDETVAHFRRELLGEEKE